METKGIIKLIRDTQSVSEKFSKREIILTEDFTSQYPQVRIYELQQDNCSKLDNFKVGDEVIVEFNRNGRSWLNPQGEEKFFNTDVIWKIQPVGPTQNPTEKEEDLAF